MGTLGHLSHIKIKHYEASLASLREQCRVPSPILCLPPPGFPPVPLLPPGFLLLFYYYSDVLLLLSVYFSTSFSYSHVELVLFAVCSFLVSACLLLHPFLMAWCVLLFSEQNIYNKSTKNTKRINKSTKKKYR